MSREIKFRAYQKTPSLNHKPSLYEVTGLDFYEGDYGGGEVCLRNKKGEQWTEYIKDVVLEQYTGLKDKNGKEIYEGDIVFFFTEHFDKATGGFDGEDEHNAIVEWFDNSFAFMDKVPYDPNIECEVIGNIHENIELLETKK